MQRYAEMRYLRSQVWFAVPTEGQSKVPALSLGGHGGHGHPRPEPCSSPLPTQADLRLQQGTTLALVFGRHDKVGPNLPLDYKALRCGATHESGHSLRPQSPVLVEQALCGRSELWPPSPEVSERVWFLQFGKA
jgi:hypothetical protein